MCHVRSCLPSAMLLLFALWGLFVWLVLLLLLFFVCLFFDRWLVGCLTSQQHARVSQGRICSDNFTCCHTDIPVADQTFHLIQSRNTETGPTSPSTDPVTPGAWQGSHWSANFQVTGMTRPRKNPGVEPWTFRSRGGRFNHLASEAVVGRWLGVKH